jgi:hypothetical protein
MVGSDRSNNPSALAVWSPTSKIVFCKQNRNLRNLLYWLILQQAQRITYLKLSLPWQHLLFQWACKFNFCCTTASQVQRQKVCLCPHVISFIFRRYTRHNNLESFSLQEKGSHTVAHKKLVQICSAGFFASAQAWPPVQILVLPNENKFKWLRCGLVLKIYIISLSQINSFALKHRVWLSGLVPSNIVEDYV